MKIFNLKLRNYRNHQNLSLDFDGNSILIKGPNGSGKSNILEAIHLLSTTKSLRTKYDKELISHNNDVAHIEAASMIDNESVNLHLTVAANPDFENTSKKIAKINKVNKSLSSFAGTLTSVLFAPTDIEILTGSPTLRRKYIDGIFFQIDKDYKKAHAGFVKAVRQRNKVLEKICETGYGKNELPYWNEKVLEFGQHIQKKRADLFEFLQDNILSYTQKLNSKDTVYKINYVQNKITSARLAEYEHKEIAARNTLLGPHRDDFFVEFNDFDIALYGSRGQQRTLILALKLCEIDYILEKLKHRPILLLDDIFSELDPTHKDAVNSIIGLQQTIITSAADAQDELSINTL
jgi:DNA replication and repair protein RecF